MTQTPYVDLSHPIEPDTPPFPGDPQVEIRVLATTEDSVPEGGVACNTSQVVMPIHCGTHMDAPYHFFGDGITIDRVDLSRCTGSAVLLKLPPNTDVIGVKHLEPYAHLFSEHPRVIFNTGWSKQWKAKNFFTEHSVISTDAAELLVQSKVQLVGVDFPSVDYAPHSTHVVLLGNSLLIVENLTRLDELSEEACAVIEFLAIPMAIQGRDGSPVRAVGRRLQA